jgi:hypothetical protein
LDQYRNHLDLHISPLIGKTKLSAITVPFVRAFEDRLREDRSPAMVRKIMVSLLSILSDAQERGLVAQNAAYRLRAKRQEDSGRQKYRLQIGVDIPAPAEIREIVARSAHDSVAVHSRECIARVEACLSAEQPQPRIPRTRQRSHQAGLHRQAGMATCTDCGRGGQCVGSSQVPRPSQAAALLRKLVHQPSARWRT